MHCCHMRQLIQPFQQKCAFIISPGNNRLPLHPVLYVLVLTHIFLNLTVNSFLPPWSLAFPKLTQGSRAGNTQLFLAPVHVILTV